MAEARPVLFIRQFPRAGKILENALVNCQTIKYYYPLATISAWRQIRMTRTKRAGIAGMFFLTWGLVTAFGESSAKPVAATGRPADEMEITGPASVVVLGSLLFALGASRLPRGLSRQ
jgi:hypothetical protein